MKFALHRGQTFQWISFLFICPHLEAARSDGSLTLDGLQGQYAPVQPATPGYVFVTPKRAPGKQ